MDNLTHSLFALTLARTPLGRAGRGTTAALLLASNAPDVDVVSTLRGTAGYLTWHRGPTHGSIGAVALGLCVAGAVWAALRALDRRTEEPRAPFVLLTAVSIIGTTLHVLMDLPTSYGTRLLSPFDWHWFALDWMPIIDVYLLCALAAGLAFGSISPAARRRNAAIVLALMAGNYGLRGAAHEAALANASRVFGPLLPRRCSAEPDDPLVEYWPRPLPSSPQGAERRCLVELAAMPTFLSPFRWQLIARLSNAYELHEINLLDARFRRPPGESEVMWRTTRRFANVWTGAAETAAAAPLARAFLGFSRLPAASSVVDPDGGATVRWTDMRFVGPVAGIDRTARGPLPFSITVRVSTDGRILDQRFGP